MVNQYSLAVNGDLRLSAHFKVREFRCPDGSDIILIDTRLIDILEQLRGIFAKPVYIRSGYRTLSYNSRIGGAVGSHHIRGQAADIDVGLGDTQIDPLLVAMTAQALGSTRIGCYRYSDGSSWIHVGSATGSSYWTQAMPGVQVKIDTFLPTLRRQLVPVKSEFCAVMQRLIGVEADGKFGAKTKIALIKFQAAHGLVQDGICGAKTWAALLIGG